MKITAVIETRFSGAHTVKGHPLCEERHGHTWRVRIEIAADEKNMDVGSLETITNVVTQYHRCDLDRFLPGVETSASGLAYYFREQLSYYPVSAIEVVTDDGYGVKVEWPVR